MKLADLLQEPMYCEKVNIVVMVTKLAGSFKKQFHAQIGVFSNALSVECCASLPISSWHLCSNCSYGHHCW